jgi:hypothetical protein
MPSTTTASNLTNNSNKKITSTFTTNIPYKPYKMATTKTGMQKYLKT